MTWRTRIGLWVVCVVLFVVFYRLFNHPGGPPPPQMNLVVWMPVVFVVLFFVFFAFNITRTRRGLKLHNEGVLFLSQGRASEALARFLASRPYLRRYPLVPANIGSALLSLWRLNEAEPEFAQAMKGNLTGNIAANVAPRLALTRALLGNVATAQETLAQTQKLGCEAVPEALLAQSILACRAGQWAPAAKLLARNEIRALGGSPRSLAEALQAWCAEQLRGERRTVDVVGVLGEAGPDRLRTAWPELADFLDRARAWNEPLATPA